MTGFWANITALKSEIISSCGDTMIMVGLSAFFAVIGGGILGILLFVTAKKQILAQPLVHQLLSQLVNFVRAFPFVILMVALLGITQTIIGTSIGPFAAAFILAVAGSFYFARLVEQNLREVPKEIIEAAQILGAGRYRLIFTVLLPEALPALILSTTVLIISLLSGSASAGMIGGGGLGDLAIRYGYQRYQADIIIFIVLILAVTVLLLQALGNGLAKLCDKK